MDLAIDSSPRWQKIIGRSIDLLLIVFAVAQAVLFSFAFNYPFERPKRIAYFVLGLLIMALFALHVCWARSPLQIPRFLAWGFLLMALAFGLSAPNILRWDLALEELARWVLFFSLAAIAAERFRQPKFVSKFLGVSVVLVVGLGLYSLLQWVGYEPILEINFGYPAAFSGYHNFHSEHVVLYFPFAFVGMLVLGPWWRGLLVVATAVMLATLYVIGSRAAFVGLLAGGVGVAGLLGPRYFWSQRSSWFKATVTCLFMVALTWAIFAAFLGLRQGHQQVSAPAPSSLGLFDRTQKVQRAYRAGAPLLAAYTSERSYSWRQTARMIVDHPLGVGWGQYAVYEPHYSVAVLKHPHSFPLQLTAELGFLGLLAASWLLVYLLYGIRRTLVVVREGRGHGPKGHGPEGSWVDIATSAVVMIFLAQSLFAGNFVFSNSLAQFSLLVGLTLARTQAHQRSPWTLPVRPVWLWLVLLVVTGALMVPVLRNYAADQEVKALQAAMKDHSSGDLLGQARDLVARFPNHVDGLLVAADVLMKVGQSPAGLLQSAVARDPYRATAYRRLGVLAATQGDWPGAVAFLRQAIALAPVMTELYHILLKISLAADRPETMVWAVQNGCVVALASTSTADRYINEVFAIVPADFAWRWGLAQACRDAIHSTLIDSPSDAYRRSGRLGVFEAVRAQARQGNF